MASTSCSFAPITIVTVASPVRRRNPAPESAAPTSEWQRLSTLRRVCVRRSRVLLRAPIHDAALHHQLHLAQCGDVSRRITVDRDEVREQTGLHGADAVV